MTRILLLSVTNLAVLTLLGLLIAVVEVGVGTPVSSADGRALMLAAAVCGFGGALASLLASRWAAKRSMGIRVIVNPETELENWLCATVERLARQSGIRTPQVGIFPAQDANALATGASRHAALVAVSTKLLQNMPRAQVEAVLAHEVAHVASGDMVTLALLQGVLNTFVIYFARILGNMVDRVIFKNERGEPGIGFFAATMVAQMLLGMFASMIVNAYSRQREFRADRDGARLAGAGAMIDALEFLKRDAGGHLPRPMQAFGITNGSAAGVRRLFMTHPSLDARIAALLTSDPLAQVGAIEMRKGI